MPAMPQPFLQSLTGKTLVRLAAGGAAVLLAATAVGGWLRYRGLEEQAVLRLTTQAAAQARVAERVLVRVSETHEVLRRAFVDLWPGYQGAGTLERFDALMNQYPDGAWRNRQKFSDGTRFATGWIRSGTVLTEDLRRRTMLFYDLSTRYGPGAAMRRDNLFFVSVPEQSNMGFDPTLFPNWVYDVGGDFTMLDFEWGRLGYAPAPPGARAQWAIPYVDSVGPQNGPMFTLMTPLHVGERHVGAIGSSVLLKDLLEAVLRSPAPGTRFLMFHPDGRLMVDTALADRMSPSAVGARLDQLGGDLPAALQSAARDATDGAASGYSGGSDAYLAVARIEGPGWLVASVLPGAAVRSQALGVALLALAVGGLSLLTMLAVFTVVLRRQVAAPLNDLTLAAERVAAGDTAVHLPATRDDEVGQLARSFNDMAAKVAERDASLREDKLEIEAALTSLRLTEERWRAMTDHASDFIAVVAGDGTFSYVSLPVQRMLGVSADSLVGRDALELMHPEDREALRPRLFHPSGPAAQFRARHADGTWRVLEAVGRDLRAHPAVQGLVLNIRDVSEIVKAEQEVVRQRESLHQSEKLSALGGLLAGVAHELNNPLAVVVGRAVQLEDGAAEASVRDIAAKIRNAAERCARIVKTFLAMARRQDTRREPTAINEVINDALDVLAYTLQSSGVQVDIDLGSGLPPVLADASQLGQVFMNLFTNAQQAMAGIDGPRLLTVRTRADGDMLRVEVSDTGPGIPAELASRIFEPFFTTKAVGEGTGVGLSVSLGIAQAHGGTISLQPAQEGRGAGFVLSLPALRGAGAAGEASRHAPAAAGRGADILVVDDEVEIAEILRDILRPAGHRVTLAHSGEQALRELDASRFDLVLTDLKMPGMDGPALYREIQKRHAALARRVIAVTGDTLGTGARDFVQATRVPVVDKPFQPDDVLGRVDEVLRRT